MTLDQVLTLLNAGYTKEEISQLATGPETPETDKPVEIKVEEKKQDPAPEQPKPEETPEEKPEEKPDVQFDYARMSKELLKAMAGQDNGNWIPPKTKEEQLDEALFSFLR